MTALLLEGTMWCPVSGETDALAIEDGRIVARGEEARRWATDRGVTATDAGDGLLLPALGDGHAHPLFGGLEGQGPAVRGASSVEEIVEAVRRFAEQHPELPVIRGASYDASLVPGGLFDARWLDEAVPDRPVVLRAWDYHTVWVNSAALAAAGIDSDTPEPVLGQIDRREDGSPLGTLREWGAVDLVDEALGPWELASMVEAVETATRRYLELGITWVQDAWVTPLELPAWIEAARTGRLHARVNLALYADPRRWPDQLDELLAMREAVRELGNPMLTAETVKFFGDGVVENATAALLSPYATLADGLAPGSHREAHAGCRCAPDGMLVWPADLLADALTAVDAHGFQAHVHAIGDRASRVALDAIEHASRTNGPRDRRPVIAHVQLVDRADRERFAALGVVANAEPLWAQLDALMEVLTIPRLGDGRVEEQYAFADLVGSGAVLSMGSDWPVSAAEPFAGIAVACTRQTDEGAPHGGWVPAQRLAVADAVRAYTAGCAHQAFRRAGTLEVGADADLVLLSDDPRAAADRTALARIGARRTWLAGRLVHDADHPRS